MSYRYYVGIDQSYSSTGLVILDRDTDVVRSYAIKAGKPTWPFHERLTELWHQISMQLPEAEETIICMEGAAFGAEFNVFMLGELSGALKYCMATAGYKYFIVAPTVLKKYATGSGNATKPYVAAYVRSKWRFDSSSNDIVDAYVLAKIAELGKPPVFEDTKPKKKRKPAKQI